MSAAPVGSGAPMLRFPNSIAENDSRHRDTDKKMHAASARALPKMPGRAWFSPQQRR